MHVHKPTLALLATACAALLAACGTGGSTAPATTGSPVQLSNTTAGPGASLPSMNWWIFYRPVLSLDPVKFDDYPEDTVGVNLCDSLVRVDADYKLQPGLATSWTATTPTSWVFKLRQGVTFWDGSPVTAADVAFSINRNFDPANASSYALNLNNVAAVKASAADEVTVTLKKPDVTLPENLIGGASAVVSQAFASKAGADFGNPAKGIMCSGAYQVASWDGSTTLKVTANPGYWDTAHAPKTKDITFVWPQDSSAVTNGFTTGTFDGGFNVPPSAAAALANSTAGKLYVGSESQTLISNDLAFVNYEGSAVASPLVRKAFSLAIDRKAIANLVFDGYATPSAAVAGKGYWSYGRSIFEAAYAQLKNTQDLTAAKALVAQAGATAKLPIVFAAPAGQSQATKMMSILQQNAKAIGLDFQIKSVPAEQYGALFADPSARKGINGLSTLAYTPAADPLLLYARVYGTGGSSNYLGYSNPKVDALIDQGLATVDDNARATIVTQIQAIALDELPWIPLTSNDTILFQSKKVTGAPVTFSYMGGPWAAGVGAP